VCGSLTVQQLCSATETHSSIRSLRTQDSCRNIAFAYSLSCSLQQSVNLDNIELVIKLTYTVEMITDLGGVNVLMALFIFLKTSVSESDVYRHKKNDFMFRPTYFTQEHRNCYTRNANTVYYTNA